MIPDVVPNLWQKIIVLCILFSVKGNFTYLTTRLLKFALAFQRANSYGVLFHLIFKFNYQNLRQFFLYDLSILPKVGHQN